MARTVRDARIETRSARLELKPKGEPYWRSLGPGTHLGYYRPGSGKAGSWIARFRPAGQKAGGYRKERLGTADDIRDADGGEVLSFAQAQEKARAWFVEAERETSGAPEGRSGPYTVQACCTDYLTWFASRRKSIGETSRMIRQSILPALGDLDARKLTARTIREWHENLARYQRGTRRGASSDLAENLPADRRRARQATANRHLTVLKAVLNYAYREGRLTSDDAWRRVRPFAKAEASRLRWLSEEECRRLLNASPADLRSLITGALMTGARLSELTSMTVGDVHIDAGTVFVEEAKSSRPRHIPLDQAGRRFLEKLVAGRKKEDRLFRRQDGSSWGKGHQRRPLLNACQHARIDPPASFHVLRHTYASQRIMKGAPLIVVAQALGHSDTRMVERHYGHLAHGYVRQVIEATRLDLGDEIDAEDAIKPFVARPA